MYGNPTLEVAHGTGFSHTMSVTHFSLSDTPVIAVCPLPPQSAFIRHLSESDVRELEWHGGEDLRDFYHQMAQAHRGGDVLYLVADLNGFPVGQIIVHWSGKPSQPDMPDLQSLRVHPVVRGQGLGSQLLVAAEMCVAEAGYPRLSLSVGVENPKARKLYERCGYQVASEIYTDVWETKDARDQKVILSEVVVDMVKELALRAH